MLLVILRRMVDSLVYQYIDSDSKVIVNGLVYQSNYSDTQEKD